MYQYNESTDLNKCFHINVGGYTNRPNTFLPDTIGKRFPLDDVYTYNGPIIQLPPKTSEIRDDFTGEITSDVIEGLIYLLIQKGIIKDAQEFKDIIDAIKVLKTLEKSNQDGNKE